MRFVHITFLITLWNKCREVLPNTSKDQRLSLIKSIGYSKFKTASTKHILADEASRLKAQIASETVAIEELIHAINVWMQTASELNMFVPTQMQQELNQMVDFVAA